MLRFLIGLCTWVVILSGVLIGSIRAARSDHFSCLSFDNLTVQLNGSRYHRRMLPIQQFSSPDLRYVISLEQKQGPAPRHSTASTSPLPAFERQITLTTRATGARTVIQPDVLSLSRDFHWSPDSRYLAYAWITKAGNTVTSIISLTGQQVFTYQTAAGQQTALIGWLSDSRYFMLRYSEFQNPYASTFLIVDIETQQSSALYRAHPSRLYSDIGRIQAVGLKHFAFFDGREIVLLDLARQVFLSAPVANVTQLASLLWSYGDQYLAVSYNELVDTEPNNRDFRENVTRILEIGEGAAAEIGRTRAWPQLGTTPKLTWSPDNRYLFMESTDTVTRNARLLVYDREQNRTESIAYPLRYFSVIPPYLMVIGDSADHQTSRLEIRYLETLQVQYQQTLPRENLMAYTNNLFFLIRLPLAHAFSQEDFFLFNRIGSDGISQSLLLADFAEEFYGDIFYDVEQDMLWLGFPGKSRIELHFVDLLDGSIQQINLPHPESWQLDVIPLVSRDEWLVILADTQQDQLFLYRINLRIQTVAELADSPYQGVGNVAVRLSQISPDQRSVMIFGVVQNQFQPLIFNLDTQAFDSPGVFRMAGSLPVWTQCDY